MPGRRWDLIALGVAFAVALFAMFSTALMVTLAVGISE